MTESNGKSPDTLTQQTLRLDLQHMNTTGPWNPGTMTKFTGQLSQMTANFSWNQRSTLMPTEKSRGLWGNGSAFRGSLTEWVRVILTIALNLKSTTVGILSTTCFIPAYIQCGSKGLIAVSICRVARCVGALIRSLRATRLERNS